jgi:hypothetical protein
MQHYQTIQTEDKDGFQIVFSVTHEDTHPKDLFDDTPEEMAELCEKIDNGYYSWFVARVQAFRHGVLLADDYLGGCLYENYTDFIKQDSDYYEDMVGNVITEANKKIALLADTLETV